MMPVYFHLQSHLWVVYLFFVNGFLLHSCCQNYSNQYAEMTRPLEASVLSAFFASLILNSCLLLLLDLTGLPFSNMSVFLPITTLCLLTLMWRLGWSKIQASFNADFSLTRLCLYGFVFIILFYNGGLIEQISDAWWHMSLANKIALQSTFSPEVGHLTGVPTRYYPPLWHGNLALTRIMSDMPIAVYWNTLTGWAAVLKVMAFYLLAFALSGKKSIASLSAILFVFLPGLGDSYLRVSAWPSHIAYIAMFALFYVSFWIVDHYKQLHDRALVSVLCNVIEQKQALFVLLLLVMIILFAHQLELFWFYCGITFYLIGLSIYRLCSKHCLALSDSSNSLLMLITVCVLFVAISASVYGFVGDWQSFENNLDRLLVYVFFLLLFSLLLIAFILQQYRWTRILKTSVFIAMSVAGFLILISIDVRHMLALFWSDMAYPIASSPEVPHKVTGLFGGDLILPGWHLQLRSALLYSGLASIPLSIGLMLLKPSRLSIFLCANGVIALLFCVSPYLYQWLTSVLNYHSTWRIMTLLFHPIIIAAATVVLWEKLRARSSNGA